MSKKELRKIFDETASKQIEEYFCPGDFQKLMTFKDFLKAIVKIRFKNKFERLGNADNKNKA